MEFNCEWRMNRKEKDRKCVCGAVQHGASVTRLICICIGMWEKNQVDSDLNECCCCGVHFWRSCPETVNPITYTHVYVRQKARNWFNFAHRCTSLVGLWCRYTVKCLYFSMLLSICFAIILAIFTHSAVTPTQENQPAKNTLTKKICIEIGKK